MTADDTYLLRAIFDDPEDDTVRLAYADFLDETDRPVRARYIRLSIEDANRQRAWAPPLSDRAPPLIGLVAEYGQLAAQDVELGWEARAPYVKRGFVYSLEAHADEVEGGGSDLDLVFERHPVESVVIRGRAPYCWPRGWLPQRYTGLYFWNLDDGTGLTGTGTRYHHLPTALSELVACDELCLHLDVGGAFFKTFADAKRAARRAAALCCRERERERRR